MLETFFVSFGVTDLGAQIPASRGDGWRDEFAANVARGKLAQMDDHYLQNFRRMVGKS